MGLVKATDADQEWASRFSTYAVPVILGEMRRLFRMAEQSRFHERSKSCR